MQKTRIGESIIVAYVAGALTLVVGLLIVSPFFSFATPSEAHELADDPDYALDVSEADVNELLQISNTYIFRSFDFASREKFKRLVAYLVRKYLLESLEHRLASLQVNKRIGVPVLNAESREELDDFEWIERENMLDGRRTYTSPNRRRVPSVHRGILLKQLHEGTVDDFIHQNGVGVYRMRMTNENIHPLLVAHCPTEQPGSVPEMHPSDLRAPNNNELKNAHRVYRDSFVFEEGWGYVRSKNEVAGFVPHRFGSVSLQPWNEESNFQADNALKKSDWRVASVKLVSLLMHSSPQVYEIDKLPNMDEVKDVPTRKLSSWESASLERLRAGENVFLDESPEQIRMFGAIRANKECLQCHDASRGELLGAFTYLIVP